MAKAAYLKKLFESYRDCDWESFKSVAQYLIDDERKKNHHQLADDLQRIINYSSIKKQTDTNFKKNYLHLLPKDKDSNYPLLEIKHSNLLFEDLILTQDISTILKEIIYEHEHEELLAAYGLSPRSKFLFCGPPGCGKTVTAEAVAGELNLPILYTRFDSIISSYLGETASNLKKVFDFISQGTWLLFFDEFDAIGKSRDNHQEHGELKRLVNTFLQTLDNYEGDSIIIAATNHQNLLDSAIWRRFDEVSFFDKPDINSIEQLILKQLRRYPSDINNLASLANKMIGFSHAEIDRVCINAIKKAIINGKEKLHYEDMDYQINLYYKRIKIGEKERQE